MKFEINNVLKALFLAIMVLILINNISCKSKADVDEMISVEETIAHHYHNVSSQENSEALPQHREIPETRISISPPPDVESIIGHAGEAAPMYILHMRGAEDHVVYVNGFKHFSQEGDEDNLPLVTTVLVEGVNTVVIISGGNVSGKIEKFAPKSGISILCDWDLDENAPAEVTLTFELAEFEYEWSWMNAEQIAEITPVDHAEISQKVNEVISAFEDGENDLDSVLQSHLKYDMIDAALAVGVTEERLRQSTVFFYSLTMSPEKRLEWVNFQGDIVTNISPYNNRVIEITRENNEPLMRIKTAMGEDDWYEERIMYGIKIGGQWYIY